MPVSDVEARALDDAPPPTLATDTLKRYAVQVGAFADRHNAERLKRALGGTDDIDISEVKMGKDTYYRVKLGEADMREEARETLRQVVDAGHQDAIIIEQWTQ